MSSVRWTARMTRDMQVHRADDTGLIGVTCETGSPDIHQGEASNGRLVLN